MNENNRNALLARNHRIIQAVTDKANLVCPGAVDLIAIAGSFASGDYYEKSDLDLLIVVNSESGRKLAKAVIIGDVGHDIYCQTWERLERMAGYPDPHVIKLLNVNIVYAANQEVEARYLSLREKLRAVLARPFCLEDLEKGEKYYHSALEALGKLFLSDEDGTCKYLSAVTLYYIEYVVYMVNKAYVGHGIQSIPAEISALGRLPDGFMDAYCCLIEAEGAEQVKSAAKALVKLTGDFLAALRAELSSKPPITPNALAGTYEEAFSNWRWKMHRAVQLDSPYLSLMTAASCQDYYDDFFADFNIPHFDLFSSFSVQDLAASAAEFDRVLEAYGRLYADNGLEICRYPSLEEFEQDYIRPD